MLLVSRTSTDSEPADRRRILSDTAFAVAEARSCADKLSGSTSESPVSRLTTQCQSTLLPPYRHLSPPRRDTTFHSLATHRDLLLRPFGQAEFSLLATVQPSDEVRGADIHTIAGMLAGRRMHGEGAAAHN